MDNIIVLATSNKNKIREIRELLKDFPVQIKSVADFGPMPEPVEDGATFDDNAYKKAFHYAICFGDFSLFGGNIWIFIGPNH